MSKKIVKILTIILYISFITCIISNTYATITDNFKGNVDGVDEDAMTSIKEILKAVLTVIRTVGVFIAVALLMILACKYIIASAGDRADIKKHAISYIIGAIILFATSGIAEILKGIIDSSFGNNTEVP